MSRCFDLSPATFSHVMKYPICSSLPGSDERPLGISLEPQSEADAAATAAFDTSNDFESRY